MEPSCTASTNEISELRQRVAQLERDKLEEAESLARRDHRLANSLHIALMHIEGGNPVAQSEAHQILCDARNVIDVHRGNTVHFSAGPVHVGVFLRQIFRQEVVCEQDALQVTFFVGDKELKPGILAVNLMHDPASNCFKHAGKEVVQVQVLAHMICISNKISGQRAGYSSNSGLLAMQAEARALGIPCRAGVQGDKFVVELSLRCHLTAPQCAQQVPTTATEPDLYGIEEFSWLVVEDDPKPLALLTRLMARVGITNYATVQTADEVRNFSATAVSHTSAALSINLKTICLMDEHLSCYDDGGQHFEITGTELRQQLQDSPAAKQFLEEGSLLLMALSGGEVEDGTLVHVFQKGASSSKNVLQEAVAVARAIAHN